MDPGIHERAAGDRRGSVLLADRPPKPSGFVKSLPFRAGTEARAGGLNTLAEPRAAHTYKATDASSL